MRLQSQVGQRQALRQRRRRLIVQAVQLRTQQCGPAWCFRIALEVFCPACLTPLLAPERTEILFLRQMRRIHKATDTLLPVTGPRPDRRERTACCQKLLLGHECRQQGTLAVSFAELLQQRAILDRTPASRGDDEQRREMQPVERQVAGVACPVEHRQPLPFGLGGRRTMVIPNDKEWIRISV